MESKCPKCGSPIELQTVHNGLAEVQAEPAHCFECGWAESCDPDTAKIEYCLRCENICPWTWNKACFRHEHLFIGMTSTVQHSIRVSGFTLMRYKPNFRKVELTDSYGSQVHFTCRETEFTPRSKTFKQIALWFLVDGCTLYTLGVDADGRIEHIATLVLNRKRKPGSPWRKKQEKKDGQSSQI